MITASPQGPPEEEFIFAPGALPETPVRVPLVIYIGDERKIIGDAIVEPDGTIDAHIDPFRGQDLTRLVQDGVLQNVSVTFNAPPATPIFKDGHVRWKKDY